MINEVRDALGQFAPKSEVPRKVRSVNLTDDVWQWLAAVAKKVGMSRNDYLEALASEDSNPLMETAIPQTSPFIETAQPDLETTAAKMAHQPDSEVLPLIETVRAENQQLHIELGNSESEKESLEQELMELRSQFETECANREEVEAERKELAQLKKQVKADAAKVHAEGRAIEAQKDRWQGELSEARSELAAAKATINQLKGKIVDLERGYTLKPNPAESRLRLEIGELQSELSDLKQKSAAASELPEAADLLNQLKAMRKKSKTDLADLEAILEILEI